MKRSDLVVVSVVLLYPLAQSSKTSRWVVYLPSGAVYTLSAPSCLFQQRKFGDTVVCNPIYLTGLTPAQMKRVVNKGYNLVHVECVSFNRGDSQAMFHWSNGEGYLPIDYVQNPMPMKKYLYWDAVRTELKH